MESFAQQTDALGSETIINRVLPTIVELTDHVEKMKSQNNGVSGQWQYAMNLKSEMNKYFK